VPKKSHTFFGNQDLRRLGACMHHNLSATKSSNIARLLAKVTIAISVAFALGRTFLKARPHPTRSTKSRDGLTLPAFDLAFSQRITFREARKQLERSAAASRAQRGRREPHLERRLHVALNRMTPVLSPEASV
jgi:hypothetical protein